MIALVSGVGRTCDSGPRRISIRQGWDTDPLPEPAESWKNSKGMWVTESGLNRFAEVSAQSEADVQRLRKKVGEPAVDSYTPLGDVLDTLLLEYGRQTGNSPGCSRVKKRIFLVITDGAPSKSTCRFFPRIGGC